MGNQTDLILQRNARADQLQLLRFLAFFCVFVGHAEVWLFFPFPSANCDTVAVAFFFLLSGFVTGYSAYGKEIRLSAKVYASGIWKKIRRIYPLYFFTTLVFVLGSDLLAQIAAGEINETVLRLMKNLLLIQTWFPEDPMSFNGLGWYVSALMFLNLFSLPTVFLFSKISRHPKRFYLFSGIICLTLFATAVYCYLTKTWNLSYWHYVFPPARSGEFIGGVALGYWVSIIQPHISFGKIEKWLFTVLEIGALVFWFRCMYYFGSPWRVRILNWIFPHFILLTVFTLGRGWVSDLFRRHPLVRLGDISFECYLIHNILVKNLNWNCPGLAETQRGKMFAFLFCFCMSVLMALYLNKPSAAVKSK